MKVAMIFPMPDSERAIGSYSLTHFNAIKKSGVDIENLSYKAGNTKSFFKLLKKLKNYDIIHMQHEYNLLGNYGLPFFLIMPLIKLYKQKAKFVLTMHTVLSKKEKFSGNKIKIWLRKKLFYQIANSIIKANSDHIVVHADFFKDILIKDYGFKENKISVLRQGILEDIPKQSRQSARKELKLKGNVYLITGTFLPSHGVDIILKNAKQIRGTILIPVNPNPIDPRNPKRMRDYLKEMQDYAKNNSLKNVRFDVSDITDSKKLWWTYFYASDIVLLAYRGGVGSGIFANAIATGIPMVASNIKYFSEAARKYGCIEIAKDNDDFPRAINDAMKPGNYKKLKKDCEKYRKEFSLPSIGNKYKIFYESLIK